VHDPIEVIPAEREYLLEPETEGDLRVSIVSTDGMEAHEQGDQEV